MGRRYSVLLIAVRVVLTVFCSFVVIGCISSSVRYAVTAGHAAAREKLPHGGVDEDDFGALLSYDESGSASSRAAGGRLDKIIRPLFNELIRDSPT